MIQQTKYRIDPEKLKNCYVESHQGKTQLNSPTGNFFYDPWKIKEEFKGSIWEDVLSSLDFDIGEARIIILNTGTCYLKHADIDDRYHLNISGDNSYLIDLSNNQMHDLQRDGVWYKMNAGVPHTAINVGEHDRIQLVVRELLTKNDINDSVNISITGSGYNLRYVFDSVYSPWLNEANKKGYINNFSHTGNTANFDVVKQYVENLQNMIPQGFTMEIN